MSALPEDVVAWADRSELEPMQVASLAIGALRDRGELIGFRDMLATRGDGARSAEIISLIDQAISARDSR